MTNLFVRRITLLLATCVTVAFAQHDQTVMTMREDYTIVPAGGRDDGKNYNLNRLAKDKSVYEIVPLTKVSENAGATVYSGPGGRYTRLSNGTLQETVALSDSPVIATTQDGALLTLMRPAPQVPRAARNPARLESLTLPEGMAPSRISTVEGRQVILLTTGITRGKPHEAAVERAGVRNGETFYVRISNPTTAGEPPVFGVAESGAVNSYAELPPGLSQVGTPQAGTPAPFARQNSVDTAPRLRRVDGPLAFGPGLPQDVSAPAAGSATSGDRADRIFYQGRSGTIFTRQDGSGDHTYLHLDGNAKSWELSPLRAGNATRFTLRNDDAVYLAVDRGQLRVIDPNTGGQVSLPSPGLPFLPPGAVAPEPVPRVAVSAGPLFESKGSRSVQQPATVTNTFSIRQTLGGATGPGREYEIRFSAPGKLAPGVVVAKAVGGQEENPVPTVFLSEDASHVTVYTAVNMPKNQGGAFLTIMSFPK